MKKLASILLCACLMLNIVGVALVSAVEQSAAKYQATITTTAKTSSEGTVRVGDTVAVTVSVKTGEAGASVTKYNAAEIEFSVGTGFTLDVDAYNDAEGAVGTLSAVTDGYKLAIYGDDAIISSDYVAVFSFNLVAETQQATVDVTLTSAKFGTDEEALTQDLNEAYLEVTTLTFKINNVHDVTFPDGDIIAGEAKAEENMDYVFTRETTSGTAQHYDYDITVSIGGTEDTSIVESDGKWTIPGGKVTGDIVITGTRTPKEFDVTVTKDPETFLNEATDAADFTAPVKATYNTKYEVTLPANVAPGETTVGYTYTVTNVTEGLVYAFENQKFTVEGTNVTKDFAFTVKETVVETTHWTVTVEGTGAYAATGYDTTVSKEATSYTLTLNAPIEGWKYDVSATMGGETVTLVTGDAEGKATYTVNAAQPETTLSGNIVFTIVQSVDATVTLPSAEYVGSTVWLVKLMGTTQLTGHHYVYLAGDGDEDNVALLWSEKYDAYCMLIDTADKENVVDNLTAANFTIVDGAATAVSYDYNVNGSANLDANDAQFVWNMYNGRHIDVATNMAKYLSADVAGGESTNDGVVDIKDAAAIVAELLK